MFLICAAGYDSRAIGVILTGLVHDGTAGIEG
ncbi:hypothetical protein EXU57_15200 [Segetibacter sp. 3557_3]|nr:hypothetical protein EXU57_15200 [Segetibacter sp. 3557_3]